MREVPAWLALLTDIMKLIVFIGTLLFLCWMFFHTNHNNFKDRNRLD